MDTPDGINGPEPSARIPPSQTTSELHSLLKEHETKYVLSGQPTGWAAISKQVRDFDEEKVQNCKDDVDTLLVFAGLFSAILSAFLVAAYPNLQPSPMAVMNHNLERIATQTMSYKIVDGEFVAKTTLPSSPPPFQAADEDIRINILWFASLVLSLMTASFGMLVKQWLREFLAVENPSPQARLRIRHFREPQLKKWLVYEIVAFLPLLLQLSLGLFFVGLCYFTSSVHERVGQVTFPLVVGWALFFFGVTVLPIFFPRCPYRTTLLKVAVAHLHRWLFCIAERLQLKSEALVAGATSTYLPEALGLSAKFRQKLFTDAAKLMGAILSSIVHHTRTVIQAARQRFFSIEWWCTRYVALHDASVKALRGLKHTDERLLVENSALDVDILVSVDAIQVNDELLWTTIAEALRYTRPPRDEVCSLLIQMISHRVPTVPQLERIIPEWSFSDFYPLERLRFQSSEGIIHILNGYLNRIHSHHTSIYSRQCTLDRTWMCEILLLMSAVRVAYKNNQKAHGVQQIIIRPLAIQCIKQGLECMCSNVGGHQDFMSCILPNNIWRNASFRLRILTDTQGLLNIDIIKGAEYFTCIWSEALMTVRGNSYRFDWTMSDADFFDPAWDAEFATTSLKYLCALLSSEVTFLVEVNQVEEGLRESRREMFRRVFGFARRAFLRSAARRTQIREAIAPLADTIAVSLKRKWSTDILLDIWKSTTPDLVFYLNKTPWEEVFDLELTSSVPFTEDDLAILSSCITENLHQSGTDILQLLGLCYAAITFFLFVGPKAIGIETCREVFSEISYSFRYQFRSNPDARPAEPELKNRTTQMTLFCLYSMEHEHGWEHKYEYSIFPDELIDALGEVLDVPNHPLSRRLQALEWRRTTQLLQLYLGETSTSSLTLGRVAKERQERRRNIQTVLVEWMKRKTIGN